MTAAPRPAVETDPFAQMLRGSAVPTAMAAVPCLVVGFVNGPRAGLSALVGCVLVIVFFGLTLLAMKRTSSMPTTTVMMVMMATYTLKVLGLGLALFLLSRATWVNGTAVGLSIIVCAVVWIFFEMRAYGRLRILTFGTPVQDPAGTPRADAEDGRP